MIWKANIRLSWVFPADNFDHFF